jgi:hypothetical protein
LCRCIDEFNEDQVPFGYQNEFEIQGLGKKGVACANINEFCVIVNQEYLLKVVLMCHDVPLDLQKSSFAKPVIAVLNTDNELVHTLTRKSGPMTCC